MGKSPVFFRDQGIPDIELTYLLRLLQLNLGLTVYRVLGSIIVLAPKSYRIRHRVR